MNVIDLLLGIELRLGAVKTTDLCIFVYSDLKTKYPLASYFSYQITFHFRRFRANFD